MLSDLKWCRIVNISYSLLFLVHWILSVLSPGLSWFWIPNVVQDTLHMKICAILLSYILHCLQHYNVARLVWNIGIYGCHSNILRKPWSEMVGGNDFIHHYSFCIQRENGQRIIQRTDLHYRGHNKSCKLSGCVDPSAQVNKVSVKQNFKGTWAWTNE